MKLYPWIRRGRWGRCAPCRPPWWGAAWRSWALHCRWARTWAGCAGRWRAADTRATCAGRWTDAARVVRPTYPASTPWAPPAASGASWVRAPATRVTRSSKHYPRTISLFPSEIFIGPPTTMWSLKGGEANDSKIRHHFVIFTDLTSWTQ